MRSTFFPLSVALALSAVPAIAQASGPLHAFSSLDYGRQHAEGSMVFVPYLSSDTSYEQGITFYTSYFNDVQTPVAMGTAIKSVDVYVTPTAHRGDEAEYNAFFTNTSRVDAQEMWFAKADPCSISPDLATFTSGMPPELQPVVRTAAYPQACYAKIYYRTSQEAALLALLSANRGIVLQDQLPFCTAASPVFATKPLVAALETEGSLVDDASGNITGSWRKVLHALKTLKQHQPALLGGAAAASYGVTVFERDALDFAPPDTTTLLAGYDDTRMTACIPAPLAIDYGR